MRHADPLVRRTNVDDGAEDSGYLGSFVTLWSACVASIAHDVTIMDSVSGAHRRDRWVVQALHPEWGP